MSINSLQATDALTKVNGAKYELGHYWEIGLYNWAGGSADWALAEYPKGAGIKYAFYMELRPSLSDDHGFALPPEQIVPTGEEIWAFHLSAARQIIEEFGEKKNYPSWETNLP